MEQALETNAARLLNGVTDVIKRYKTQWQKTGEKYNLFKVADIAHKEVIMCRVLADLMNPQGKHGQGSRYLKSFWEAISSKLPDNMALDIEHARVTTEYAIEFKEHIVPLVQKVFPGAVYTIEDDWNMLQVPIDGGNYLLDVNYDWTSFHIEVCVGEKERNRQFEERIAKEMAARTNHKNEVADTIFALWGTNRYPGLESAGKDLYLYRLAKEYIERPQEAADRIISIAKALESVKV